MKEELEKLVNEGFEDTGEIYAGMKIYKKDSEIILYDEEEDYTIKYILRVNLKKK